MFGRETAGLPKQLLEQHREHWLRIPMFNVESRSLNLSNCVALGLFEALRQQGFQRRECERENGWLSKRGPIYVTLQNIWLGGWRSGSAAPLHGDGRGFESLIAHQSFALSAAERKRVGWPRR